jgi:carboxyl-terminal processing protease
MRQLTNWSALLLATVLSAALLLGCKKEADVSPVSALTNPTSTTAQTAQDWILENMRDVYYWADRIPASPNFSLAPTKFFESLLYDRANTANPQRDRFSWIEEDATQLVASLNGQQLSTGLEFNLFLRTQTGSDLIGKVLYVQRGSPAEKAGFRRGDYFYAVNGQRLTMENRIQLLYGDLTTSTFGLLTVNANNQLADSPQTRTVTATTLQEDPVYLDSVYTVGAKKIGYLVYNQFVPGPNGSSVATYDQKLDAVFGKFKSQGINELVLDLRYNRGGSVASATKLASLIVRGAKAGDVFAESRWNPLLTAEIKKLSNADQYFYERFVSKANNIGTSIGQVYVLATGSSASASELMINGLRPYMTVNIIGSTTYGKNVGSITISDDTGKFKYGLQPIVIRSYNSAGQSDYFQGFAPTVTATEPLVLKPLGDRTETLLATAIGRITGSAVGGRLAAEGQDAAPAIGSSIDHKAGGGNMIVNSPIR